MRISEEEKVKIKSIINKDILIDVLPLFEKSKDRFSEIYEDVKNINLQKDSVKSEQYLLDTFSARFVRFFYIYENKILKTIATIVDGKYRSALDLFNKMEQLNVISNARSFYKIKHLRNRIVHEYAEKDWLLIVEAAIKYAPTILESYDTTKGYCNKLLADKTID